MMTKRICIIIIALMILILSACGETGKNDKESDTSPSQSQTEAETEEATESPYPGGVLTLGNTIVGLPNDTWSGKYLSFQETVELRKDGHYYGKDPTIKIFYDDTDLESSIKKANGYYSSVEGSEFECEIGGYQFRGNRTNLEGITISTEIERLFYPINENKTLRIQLIVQDGAMDSPIKGVDKDDPEAQAIIIGVIELNQFDKGGVSLDNVDVNDNGLIDSGEDLGLSWSLDSEGTLTVTSDGTTIYMNSGDYPWYKYCDIIKRIVITDGTPDIPNLAFKNCTALESVEIPDSVTELGLGCFEDCANLKAVTLPKNLSKNNFFCFSGCSSLTEVTVPGSLSHIDNYTFSGCSSLNTIRIESGVISLGYGVFDSCGEVDTLYLPKSVTLIDIGSFNNMTIKDVYYEGSESDFKAIDFKSDNSGILNAEIHYNSVN